MNQLKKIARNIPKKLIITLSILIVLIMFGMYAIYYNFYNSNSIIKINYEDGMKSCFNRINANSNQFKNKKYYYFSIWNTHCKPCISEMPFQDEMAERLSKNIGFFYISDDSNEKVNTFLYKKGIKSRHFIFLNDMNDFISAIYNKQKKTFKVYPTHVVTDSVGNILFFKQGSIVYLEFPKNKILTKQEKILQEKIKDPLVLFLNDLK